MATMNQDARWPRSRFRVQLLIALTLLVLALLDSLSSREPRPFLGVGADADAELLLTEAELRAFDGTNGDKTIYVAIDGIIFDVSEAASFYGPGGHYHHFAGKDASRAWVSECWGSEDQLTWRMDGIEAMFMPKYLDEMVEATSKGARLSEDDELMGFEQMATIAKTILKKLGKVSKKQKADRRVEDAKEAKESLDAALAKWVDFFRNNDKYKNVGYVVHDKDKPEPPPLCDEAYKKRPLKYGKLDGVMSLGNNPKNRKKEPKTPDYIKEALKEKGATGPDVDDVKEKQDEPEIPEYIKKVLQDKPPGPFAEEYTKDEL